MQDDRAAMGVEFAEWQRLTDAYAAGLTDLWSQKPGAAERMREIARALELCQQEAVTPSRPAPLKAPATIHRTVATDASASPWRAFARFWTRPRGVRRSAAMGPALQRA